MIFMAELVNISIASHGYHLFFAVRIIKMNSLTNSNYVVQYG